MPRRGKLRSMSIFIQLLGQTLSNKEFGEYHKNTSYPKTRLSTPQFKCPLKMDICKHFNLQMSKLEEIAVSLTRRMCGIFFEKERGEIFSFYF